MVDPTPTRRRFSPTPSWVVFGLLVVEGLLWLSGRYRWFWFNEKKGWTVLIAVAAVGAAMLVMLLWFIAALVFRWRFQFSIRSLLVLTVAVAVPCSWLAVKMQQAKRQREVVAAIEKLGGSVKYDWQVDANGEYLPNAQLPGPACLRPVLGEDFFCRVEFVCFDNTQDTDAGLENLKGLGQLKGLWLGGTNVTDAGLENLKGLGQLTNLRIGGTNVTDAGLENLKGLGQLKWLWLVDNKVTDAGLEHLKGLGQLKWLWLNDAQITNAGVKKLQQALPNCTIYR